jgi:hypothetical protein
VREVERLGLQVRVGIQTGECGAIGDNVTGVAVAIGAGTRSSLSYVTSRWPRLS